MNTGQPATNDLWDFSTVLTFERFATYCPEHVVFFDFYQRLESIAHEAGFRFNYFGCSGSNCSSKMRKCSGSVFKDMIDKEFVGIEALSLYSVVPGSRTPAYDTFHTAILSHSKSFSNCTRCSISLNERYFNLGTPESIGVIHSLGNLAHWDYGYSYRWASKDNPIYQSLGANNGKLPSRELNATMNWNLANDAQRLAHLKGVYLLNFLSRKHLSAHVTESTTLIDFILSETKTTLIHDRLTGLSEWKVPESELARIRSVFEYSPILISNCGILSNP